jgi:hypothetical protein
VTFVLVSSQYRRTRQREPRRDQYAVDYRDQLDDAMYQVVRGSKNFNSVIATHSLGEDLYGNDGFSNTDPSFPLGASVKITIAGPPGGNTQFAQLLDIALDTSTMPSGKMPLPPSAPSALQTLYGGAAPNGYYNGCLLTMTSGKLAGHTTLIVGCHHANRRLRAKSDWHWSLHATRNGLRRHDRRSAGRRFVRDQRPPIQWDGLWL